MTNGEYISLGKIESALKSCTLVDNLIVHADLVKPDFLVALIVPNQTQLQVFAKRINNNMGGGDAAATDNEQLAACVKNELIAAGKSVGLKSKELPTKVSWRIVLVALTVTCNVDQVGEGNLDTGIWPGDCYFESSTQAAD